MNKLKSRLIQCKEAVRIHFQLLTHTPPHNHLIQLSFTLSLLHKPYLLSLFSNQTSTISFLFYFILFFNIFAISHLSNFLMFHDTLFTNPSFIQQVFRQLRIPHPPNKIICFFFFNRFLLLSFFII